MPKDKVLRYRIKDVGRPKHHYLQIAVLKGKGVKGGRTVGKLISKEELDKKIKKAREVWIKMESSKRKRVMPERKGKKGYKKVLKIIERKGKKIKTHIWIKTK